MESKKVHVHVMDKNGQVHHMTLANAHDMRNHNGWTIVDEANIDVCEACHGVGSINNEECWHCFGEKLDPTK